MVEKPLKHGELVKWWCEEFYPRHHNITYPFKGSKEGPLLKQKIPWVEKNFPEDPEKAFKQMASAYIVAKDDYADKNAHPFSYFLSKLEKWAPKKSHRRRVKDDGPTYLDRKLEMQRIQESWDDESKDDDFVQRVLGEATPDPVGYFKKFVRTESLLRAYSERRWRKTSTALAELVGKERAREIWKTSSHSLFG